MHSSVSNHLLQQSLAVLLLQLRPAPPIQRASERARQQSRQMIRAGKVTFQSRSY